MKNHFLKILLVLVLVILSACSAPNPPATEENPPAAQPDAAPQSVALLVFAAGSLTQPFTEMGDLFKAQNPGLQIDFNFQNANTLVQQILQGAPADVFASAAQKFMTTAVENGDVNESDVQVFARNKLVVIYPKNNPADIKTLADLIQPGVQLVIGAKEGPQGVYVERFLTNASNDPNLSPTYKEYFYNNVVSYESTVNGVVTKVALGEADAGIVFFSDSQGANAERVNYLEIPDSLNAEAVYPIAPLKDAPNPEMAKAFVEFVLSPAGQDVLAKYGFLPVQK